MALLMSGCGAPKTDTNGAGGQSDAKKSELHVAIAANPPSLDPPAVNSNIVGGIGIHVYESLFAMNVNYEPTPVLADSYEVSEDGITYTIKLREDVKFHNGEKMTADDVVAFMNRWLEISPKANTLIGGSVFEKVDDFTVTLSVDRGGTLNLFLDTTEGINAEVESYDFSTFMEYRADPKQFDMFITSNSYNMLPIQLSVLDSGWAGLDRPEIAEGITAIRSAASEEGAYLIMASYVLKRILSLIPVLFVVSVVTYLVVYLIPGGPATALLGMEATPIQIDSLNAELGFNRSFVVQYAEWLSKLLHGDWGTSFFLRQSVLEVIKEYFRPTLSLAY